MSKKQRPVPRRRLQADQNTPTRATAADLDARYSFRRNRTLTGSLSSEVASANENRAELKSPRVHAHHLRRRRRHVFSTLLGVVALSLGLAFLVTQAILSVRVTAGANVELYAQKIDEYLASRPFERFRFSLNTAALVNYLQLHDAPEVESISNEINSPSFGVATIEITLRRPAVAWETAGQKMYVDTEGNAFTRNAYGEPSVQVVDQTGIQATNNQVLASNRFLAFIGKVIGRMQGNGFTVSKIILPADTTRQVQVVVNEVPYAIKFSVDRPAGEQAEDAARAIKYLQDKGVSPEYLDVRVSGKAYYK